MYKQAKEGRCVKVGRNKENRTTQLKWNHEWLQFKYNCLRMRLVEIIRFILL